MRRGQRDRLGAAGGERLYHAVGTGDELLDNRGRQYPLAFADLRDIVAEAAQIIRQA
jgi:hypothetical protein